jgi:hypothetical protein
MVLHCTRDNIEALIDIYDKKYSSPDIKSLVKLLISLIWIQKPLRLSDEVIEHTLDLVWKNCSEDKPYFYNISSALLVSKYSLEWVQNNDHQKARSLIKETKESISKGNEKALKSQMFMLSILSYHESAFFRQIGLHVDLYNALKVKSFADNEVL